MKKCAFLSMDDIGEYYVYDDLLIEPMAGQGWQVETLSWRNQAVDWSDFDAVVIRSCWDYQQSPDDFLDCLARIDEQTLLLNDLATVRWNISKAYLKDMDAAGVPVVPTLWQPSYDPEQIHRAFSLWEGRELIIKPLISASAEHTYRLTPASLSRQLPELERVFADRAHMLQPFIPAVLDEGEYSLFYFGHQFSHGIRKVPKQGDFRVQEEHGGGLHLIQPDNALLAVAEQTLRAIPGNPLYARLDFIRYRQQYVVMELELIEPSLYFNMDGASAQRFVQALIKRIASEAAKTNRSLLP